jgi:hypothetical protein
MNGEKGSALILALIISIILMVFGLAVSLTSLSDFTMSLEFEGHKRALHTAEAGLAEAQRSLRGRTITAALQDTRQVPVFVADGPAYHRDPVAFREARSVDYWRPPSPISAVSLNGLLTPGLGTALGRGRFIARISDNDDGDGDLLVDSDNEFFIRVAGIEPGPPQEVVLFGSNLKNSVAVIEASFKRDFSFDVSSPFSVYGSSVVPSSNRFFNGNSFHLNGYDHSGMTLEEILRGNNRYGDDHLAMAGLSVLNDDPGAGDATASRETIYQGMDANQRDNIIGAEGPYGDEPSLRDDTEMVRSDDNPDSVNLFDPDFLAAFIERISAAADEIYPDGTRLSGSDIELGTPENPTIVVAEGDFSLSGGGSGAGLMVVKGKFEYNGGFNYNGLILVIGEGEVDIGGANKSVVGGIYTARVEEDAEGNAVFGTPSFTLGGVSRFFFAGDRIQMALSLLPLRMLSWREITPEIQPAVAAE